MNYSNNDILSYNNELFCELSYTNNVLNAAITCCKEREFRGEYYGIPQNYVKHISNERNEYLTLMTIVSDKIRHIDKLNSYLEQELTAYKDSCNCGR